VNEQIAGFLAKATLLQNQDQAPEELIQDAEEVEFEEIRQRLTEQKANADEVHSIDDLENSYHQAPPQNKNHNNNSNHNNSNNHVSNTPPPVTRPVSVQKIPNRNDKVTVQYGDGSVKKDVKFKSVENDLRAGKCRIIE
jgi:preprotein translocase subunit SecA